MYYFKKLSLYKLLMVLLVSNAYQIGFAEYSSDPFAPPYQVQLFYQLVYRRPDNSLPKYNMFIMRNNTPRALLDNTVVKSGDTYENLTIKKITKTAVVLETNHGDKKIIVLHGLESKLAEIQKLLEEGNNQ